MAELHDTATGILVRYVPAGETREELLGLVRIGVQFKAQHVGKKPGHLARLVLEYARRAGPPYSFAQLLDEFALASARRELHGGSAGPVEKVDRIWQLVTVHLPRRGRVQVPFKTVRNHLTDAKKIMTSDYPA